MQKLQQACKLGPEWQQRRCKIIFVSHCDYCTFNFPLFLKKIRICKPRWSNTDDYDHRRLRTNIGTPCPHPAIPCHSRCSCPAPCPFLPSMPIPAFCCCLLVCCHITKPITRHCPPIQKTMSHLVTLQRFCLGEEERGTSDKNDKTDETESLGDRIEERGEREKRKRRKRRKRKPDEEERKGKGKER